MDELVTNHGVRRALSAADLDAAHKAGQPATGADAEGLDFLEAKIERLEEAYQRGIRHLQVVHYTPNDIGDFQTGAVTHQGLTAFGAEVIRACRRLGFVCDAAHATEDMVKQAVKVVTKPLLLSHTAVSGSRAMGPTPLSGRQIGPDHARAIADTGGRSAFGTSLRASTHVSTASRRLPISSASTMSASAPTSISRRTASWTTRDGCTSLPRCCVMASALTRRGRLPAATTCASFALPSADAFRALLG